VVLALGLSPICADSSHQHLSRKKYFEFFSTISNFSKNVWGKMYGKFFEKKRVGVGVLREKATFLTHITPRKKSENFEKCMGKIFFFEKKCMGVGVLREKATFPTHITPRKKSENFEKCMGKIFFLKKSVWESVFYERRQHSLSI